MLRLPIALLFVGVASAAFADMRGQVVCGIPPDEAVAYVYESTPGLWHYIGTLGRNINDRGNPSAQTALAEHAPEGAEYVCDVEIRTADFTTAVVPLYRLHHPFIEMGAVNEQGEPLAWDYDPRGNIVGVASEARAGSAVDLGPPGLCGIPIREATATFVNKDNRFGPGGYWMAYSPDGYWSSRSNEDYRDEFFAYDEGSGEAILTKEPHCEFEVVVTSSDTPDYMVRKRIYVFRLGRPFPEGQYNRPLCYPFEYGGDSNAIRFDGVPRNAWLGPEMVQVCRFQ